MNNQSTDGIVRKRGTSVWTRRRVQKQLNLARAALLSQEFVIVDSDKANEFPQNNPSASASFHIESGSSPEEEDSIVLNGLCQPENIGIQISSEPLRAGPSHENSSVIDASCAESTSDNEGHGDAELDWLDELLLVEPEAVYNDCETIADHNVESWNVSNTADEETTDNIEDEEIEVFDLEAFSQRYLTGPECAPFLAIAYYLKHQLSDAALEDYLRMLGCTADFGSQLPLTTHLLLKKYQPLMKKVEKVYVCGICDHPLVNGADGKPLVDQPCKHKYDKETHDGCFILLLPVEEQFQYFLGNFPLHPKENPDPNYRGDVHTGKLFQKCLQQGFISESTITLQLNIDGAQIFKSSKFGFWPFMGIINEASYSVRRSNVILFALWYGNRKPPRAAFLEPVLSTLDRLASEGITFREKVYKVRPVLVTVDSVARPVLRNTTQFNGEFGCDFCLHPGKVVKVGKGNARVYPEPKEGEPAYPKRTLRQHVNDLQDYFDFGHQKHGILGDTPFLHLRGFNFIRSFVPDYMHGVCLGVIRYLLLLWTLPSHSKEPWSLRRKISVVNQRLAAAKPPYEITRTPRKLDNLKRWKATEFRAFGLYYFTVLEGILPERFYNHFMLLSYSLYVLLQDRVHISDVAETRRLLSKFVLDMEQLYGLQHIKFNCHLLVHLSDSVDNWGALWASSTFIPEHFNGFLTRLCNGTQAVADQMAQTLLLRNAVLSEVVALMEKDKLNVKIGSLFCSLLPEIPVAKKKLYAKGSALLLQDNACLLGSSGGKKLDNEERFALSNLVADRRNSTCLNLQHVVVHSYKRYQASNGSIYTGVDYVRAPKRSNYCAMLAGGEVIAIKEIVYVSELGKGEVVIFGHILQKNLQSPTVFAACSSVSPSGRIIGLTARYFYDPSAPPIAVYGTQLVRKCVITSANSFVNSMIVTALVNSKETD